MVNGEKLKKASYTKALKTIKNKMFRIDKLLDWNPSERLMNSRVLNLEALQKLIEMEGGENNEIHIMR